MDHSAGKASDHQLPADVSMQRANAEDSEMSLPTTRDPLQIRYSSSNVPEDDDLERNPAKQRGS